MNKIFVYGEVTEYINYFNALVENGFDPVFSTEITDCYIADGLLLTGGYDMNPKFYGEQNLFCENVETEKDLKELQLVNIFANANKPILGICKGIQLLNVAFGGSLYQDIPSKTLHSRCGGAEDKFHGVNCIDNCFLSRLYGSSFTVNSAHHQSIKQLADCLVPLAFADDGLVEAVSHETKPIIGVQWHPERIPNEYKNKCTAKGALLFEFFKTLF